MQKEKILNSNLNDGVKQMLVDFSRDIESYGPVAYGHYLDYGRGVWFMDLRGVTTIGPGDPYPPVEYVYGEEFFEKHSFLSDEIKEVIRTYDPEMSCVALFYFDESHILAMLLKSMSAELSLKALYELQNKWPEHLT